MVAINKLRKRKENKWFVNHSMNVGFHWTATGWATYDLAVKDAQAECQTDSRPKRLASGFYELRGNGHHVYIGTAEGFNNQGYKVNV